METLSKRKTTVAKLSLRPKKKFGLVKISRKERVLFSKDTSILRFKAFGLQTLDCPGNYLLVICPESDAESKRAIY